MGITTTINYTPDTIDEYIVIVNLPEDWDIVHNYIINENNIDGIPNRKINCSNIKNFSLRSSIYEMSVEEVEILRTHEKVESVELNPYKYPQPQSFATPRFGKVVAFNKPLLPFAKDFNESTGYTNGVRSNWSMLFASNPSSEPYQGVGIASTDTVDRDLHYTTTGNNVDAVIIDSGIAILHPEFISSGGSYRVFDVILDGPYKVDPDFFNADTTNRLETVTIDGVTIGTRAKESVARAWWGNTGTDYRSSAYASLDTISIPATYTRIHAHSKNGTNPILSSHGTACASQIGGESFGLAYECKLWNIRINLGSAGGIISADTALDACTIWHNAKKIQSTDPDPTLLNNSYGGAFETGNTNGTTYNWGYRGVSKTYVGNGSNLYPPSGSGPCRNHTYYTYNNGVTLSGNSIITGGGSGSTGLYLFGLSSTNTAAEDAIAAGCILVASAGNNNQKYADKNDSDFLNWFQFSTVYINRVEGIQQGFSGDHDVGKGTIRVGALDCAVEPADEKQGATKYSIRRAAYSANGPMIDIFAPATATMAAAYADYEIYQRQDNSSFYDQWFDGTSSAGPNTCSVIALYLQGNRSSNQSAVRTWLTGTACKNNLISDPYPTEGASSTNDLTNGYWSLGYNASTDEASNSGESYNLRGNGNLRGAPNRVLFNPFITTPPDPPSADGEFSLRGILSFSGNLNIT